jgi:hypothetical protein
MIKTIGACSIHELSSSFINAEITEVLVHTEQVRQEVFS